MKHGLGQAMAAMILATAVRAAAVDAARGRNLVGNPGFEEEKTGWAAYRQGFAIDEQVARSGGRSMRCTGATLESVRGAKHVITLDPPVKHPFRVSGWARSEDAQVSRDFNVYLDLHYADGTPLWGQVAPFETGTHDWQYSEHVFEVAKPVKTIEVFVLFREAKGTVWFDDIAVELAPFELRNVRVAPSLFGGASLAVSATTTLPAAWRVALHAPGAALTEKTGAKQPIRFAWAAGPDDAGLRRVREAGECELRIAATDDLLGGTIEIVRPVRFADDRPARGCAVWTETSMKRVLPHLLPDPERGEPRAEIELAGREYESFQIVLLAAPGTELRDVELSVSDLVCRENGKRIAAEHIEWRQVGYVKMDRLHAHPRYPDAVAGWWPDPLLDLDKVDAPAGFAQPIWVTVYAPPDTPPGKYVGAVTIRPPGLKPVDVEVAARVFGFSLPVEGRLKTAFALMDGYLEKLYGKPLTPRLRQRYGDFVLKHRLNPDDISRTSPPAIEDLLRYRDSGLNAFNVLNMVKERGERTWVCWSPVSVYTPAFKAQLIERLDAAVAELRRHGLARKAYVYTFDERAKEFFPVIREYFGLIKERYPEIPTLTTAKIPQDPEIMRDLNVDWNCPVSRVYQFDQAEACRAAGRQVWSYVCCGPRHPFANWLADDPLIEARLIWWQAYHQKMDGFLYWGLNIWGRRNNEKPIKPTDGPLLSWSITTGAPGSTWERLNGDGVLLYPGPDGPLGSIRLANIRDGLEDYEYLRMLGDRTSVDAAREACLPVTTSLTKFTWDPTVLRDQRRSVAQRVTKLLHPKTGAAP